MRLIKQAREAEDRARKAEAKKRAHDLWERAKPAPEDHAYLKAKGVKAHGLRVHDGRLVVPLRDASGELCSLQFIAGDGQKKFLPGGRVTGRYFGVGKPDGVILIAEGVATGATLHAATGSAVAIAFNAGNLEAVGKALRSRYPEIRLIVCADDDAATKSNPGMAKARAAAL